MKNKPTFFLLFIVSGASLISKKLKRTRILKKISPKTYPLDLGSKIRDPEKIHPGSGSATLFLIFYNWVK
jgi:hypothetical protein